MVGPPYFLQSSSWIKTQAIDWHYSEIWREEQVANSQALHIWLGLYPNNKVTGGKVKQRGREKTKNRVNLASRKAAQSLARSQSALGAFYRRIRAKHSGPQAVIAAARKLARIVYFMLERREPYQDPGADYYDQQYQARVIRHQTHRVAKLGFRLEPLGPDQVS